MDRTAPHSYVVAYRRGVDPQDPLAVNARSAVGALEGAVLSWADGARCGTLRCAYPLASLRDRLLSYQEFLLIEPVLERTTLE